MRIKKRSAESHTEQQYMIRPIHVNHYGRLFGGELMKWIDEVAGIAAMRHSESNITTAAIDNLQFKAPAMTGDMIVLIARVTYTGRTSMEVRVDTYKEDPDGTRHVINRAYLTEVAIDADGNPVEVPELIIESEAEQLEYESALKRCELRKQRRQEGF